MCMVENIALQIIPTAIHAAAATGQEHLEQKERALLDSVVILTDEAAARVRGLADFPRAESRGIHPASLSTTRAGPLRYRHIRPSPPLAFWHTPTRQSHGRRSEHPTLSTSSEQNTHAMSAGVFLRRRERAIYLLDFPSEDFFAFTSCNSRSSALTNTLLSGSCSFRTCVTLHAASQTCSQWRGRPALPVASCQSILLPRACVSTVYRHAANYQQNADTALGDAGVRIYTYMHAHIGRIHKSKAGVRLCVASCGSAVYYAMCSFLH